jgi:hypothetical protein
LNGLNVFNGLWYDLEPLNLELLNETRLDGSEARGICSPEERLKGA